MNTYTCNWAWGLTDLPMTIWDESAQDYVYLCQIKRNKCKQYARFTSTKNFKTPTSHSTSLKGPTRGKCNTPKNQMQALQKSIQEVVPVPKPCTLPRIPKYNDPLMLSTLTFPLPWLPSGYSTAATREKNRK